VVLTSNTPFTIKDCALVALATGKKVRTLREFRSELSHIRSSSIYHHFWGGLLQPRFEEREYNNDFASWIRHGIHDDTLAERLAVLDPTGFADIESLRAELIDRIDLRLDEVDYLHWTRASEQFEFICSQIVVFDTGRQLATPEDLSLKMASFSTSSIFYHFIDARRRTDDRRDDFSDWLTVWGVTYESLIQRLANVDPYFGSLSELRETLAELFNSHVTENES